MLILASDLQWYIFHRIQKNENQSRCQGNLNADHNGGERTLKQQRKTD